MEEQHKSDVVSVGVEINKITHLRKINQHEPLVKVLQEMCKDFNLDDSEKYSLQFDDHPKLGYNFISEENRQEIKDGSVCKLVYSPTHLVHTIRGKMVSPGSEETIWSMQKVLSFIHDKAFVEKFVEGQGITLLITLLQGNALCSEATGYAFKCLADLLNQGYVSAESIKDRIVDKVTHYILNDEKCSPNTQESCLSIANFLMEKHASQFPEIYKTVSLDRVIPYLENDDFRVQKTALGLINSIFNSANTLQRKLLIKVYAKKIRDTVYKKIITSQKTIHEDMVYHLALFQSRFVSRLRRKAESAVDLGDNVVKKRISMLSRFSLKEEDDVELNAIRRHTYIETTLFPLADYLIPPPIDSTDVPPSILVLDCMTHFIKTYQNNYIKAVLEHTKKTAATEYPFLQLCTQLINLLTSCLGITGLIGTNYPYHPVLYSCDKAFEELFCATIMVFSKTSKEMRAKSEDFNKVICVVQKKIQVVLNKKPTTMKDFEDKFGTLNYSEISKIWQEESDMKERLLLKEKKSLLQLRQQLKSEYMELIQKQRLHVLCEGSQFKYFSKSSKMKNKKIFIKYVPSKKVFEFVDEDEKFNNFNIELSHIKNIVVGQNCTHVKLRGQKYKPEFAFSLLLTDMEPNCINLAADSERQLDHVLDSFMVLLHREMTSFACDEDLQKLTDMHIRLELLDAHGIELPNGDPPPIPPDPPNYDF